MKLPQLIDMAAQIAAGMAYLGTFTIALERQLVRPSVMILMF